MTFFNLHTHQASAEAETISIQNVYPKTIAELQKLSTPFSCGIHPWYIDPLTEAEQLELLRQAAALPSCVAIGESGLDKCCDTCWELQKLIFRQTIQISESSHKPLIIHCVKAYAELLEIRKALRPQQPWIIHGFRGKPELAHQLVRSGCYLSFGSRFNTQSLLQTPLDRIFPETDDLSVSIQTIYQQIAKEKGLSLQALTHQIEANARQIFSVQLFSNLFKK